MKKSLILYRKRTHWYYILILFFLIFTGASFSQDAESSNRIIIFDSVCVNGVKIDIEKSEDIVLKTSDSVSLFYHCRVMEGEKTPFLFKTILQYENESHSKTHNSPVISYKDLPEQNYKFIVSAFDLQRNWVTPDKIINFRVNNKEAELITRVEALNAQLSDYKNEVSSLQKKTEDRDLEKKTFSVWQLLAGSFLGAAFMLFTFFVIKKNKPKNNKVPEPDEMRASNSVSKSEHNKVLHENSNLKAEIASLRGQIDALALRSNELRKRNRELEDSIASLTNSKKELEDLQVQKDELFAVIIHDIKNPAALIKNLVELLTSYDLTANEQQEVISDIVNTTSKIVSLSQEVTRILALESGRMELDFEKIDLNIVARDVFYRNRIAASQKNIEITIDADNEDCREVPCDPFKIDEVLDNLISNAIKFTQQNGKIHLSCYKKENSAVIDVSDNGLGLSEDDIKSAFKRGSKLSARPTGGESSTGLGLWIVKKIMDAHNGRVWVRSAVGKGSTFSISIPLDNEEGKVELDLKHDDEA